MSEKSDDPTKYPKAELLMEGGINVSGEAFCILRWGGEAGQLTPEETRQAGLALIATAENAERDASLFRWMDKDLGWGLNEIGGFLAQMREHRED